MKTLAYTLFLSLALGTPNAKANPIHHQLLFEEHADHIVTGTYDEIAIPELLKQYGGIMYNVGPFLINGGYIQWTDLHGQGVNVFGQFGGGTKKTYFFIDSEAQPGVAETRGNEQGKTKNKGYTQRRKKKGVRRW